MAPKARPGARSLPLGHGELLGRLTQIFVDTVQAFYVRRATLAGAMGAKTGAVTAVQRASSELSGEGDPESNLASSAVSGQSPPAGPQWSSGLRPPKLRALAYDKPLCASLDGFTLHAATRAGGLDAEGREALLRYVLRPPIAQERVEQRPDGLVRVTLKKAYADGTVAVDTGTGLRSFGEYSLSEK